MLIQWFCAQQSDQSSIVWCLDQYCSCNKIVQCFIALIFFYLVFINASILLCTPRKFFLLDTFMLCLLSLRYIYLSSFRYSRSPARPSSPPGGLEAPSSSDEEKVKTKIHQLSLSKG